MKKTRNKGHSYGFYVTLHYLFVCFGYAVIFFALTVGTAFVADLIK